MTTNIKTRWHKVLPIVESGNVSMTAPKDRPGPWFEDMGGKLPELKQFLIDTGELPHFVIERELIDLVSKDDYQRSMYDMKRGRVLRLPYPAMVVEFSEKISTINMGKTFTTFSIIRDLHAPGARFAWEAATEKDLLIDPTKQAAAETDEDMDFYGIRLSLNSDEDGEYVSLSPSVMYGAIESRDGDPWVRFGGYTHGLLPPTPDVNKLVGDTYQKDMGAVFYAASAAYLLMRTQGVDAETIDTTKINRTRSGKPSQPYIPKHVYIKIGRVYRNLKSETTDEYVPRKSPRPHWRRGHLRHVRYGSGRVNIKEIYIYPKLVALQSDTIIPTQPNYKVTK